MVIDNFLSEDDFLQVFDEFTRKEFVKRNSKLWDKVCNRSIKPT